MDYLYFHSNARVPLNKLSNFNLCKIKGVIDNEIYIFPSAEHYYLAHFMKNKNDIKKLEIGSEFSEYKSLKYFFKEDKIPNKIKYWSKKNNIGIIAKMIKNNPDKVNIILKTITHKEKEIIWTKIITDKYTQNEEHQKILLDTSDKLLIEFGKGSKKDSYYTAKVVDDEIIGKNYMGKKLMEIRKKLQNKLKWKNFKK
jgi:predicted NAD-dependent protein-ADP-ribosyltransferase YbiA (DUF1768 family)